MDNFRKTLKKLSSKILLKSQNPRIKERQNIKKFKLPLQGIKANTSLHSNKQLVPRDPYFFQIGFDFGTSSSKAIIRDINTNIAWIYTYSNNITNNTILIPSIVIYQNGYFAQYKNIDTLYPKNGLYHLKIAAQKIANGITEDQVFSEYKKIAESSLPYPYTYFIELTCIYFLSSSFSDILMNITQKFPNYGQNQDDQIAINMAMPVSDISDNNVRILFERILNISWKISCKFKPFPKRISILRLNEMVVECQQNAIENSNDSLCHVYPEVSANMQAFIRSPASSPNDSTIYFFNDTGAGTVDQCVFTYTRDNKKLNYFSDGVFLRGSSQIETIACGDNINKDNLEFWRKKKEQGENSSTLTRAKYKITEELNIDTQKTLQKTLHCLRSGPGVTKMDTLKYNIRFIFSGGGHTKFPYHYAVVEAYKDFMKTKTDPLITSMAIPQDLLIKGHELWIKRLYVAYGLSFLFEELAENSFPTDNKIDDKIKQNKTIASEECSCRGYNKNCVRCYGTGIIQ
ncbi:MAG: hypothetical protein J1E80_04045 [Desulfovibrionaceae bacterium]|nr:hypothetical protein [Desulfovibrionaceae bacterium]